jgi:hypothetical protein
LGVPLRKGVIELGKLAVGVGGEAKVRLDLDDVALVLVGIRGDGIAHAENALEHSLDHGATVTTRRW